jgi:hypothetical protein
LEQEALELDRFLVQLQAAGILFFLLSLQMAVVVGQVQGLLVCRVVAAVVEAMEALMLAVLEIRLALHLVKEAPEVLELEHLLKRLEVVVGQVQ